MIETNPVIKKATFILPNSLKYTFDVNETTTMFDLKKVLTIAAHLGKNTFRIFGQADNKDYTECDGDRLSFLFPTIPEVVFIIKTFESKKGLTASSMKLPDDEFCNIHKYKYKTLYCFNCQESLCLECFGKQVEHSNHYVLEKYDYLASSDVLVKRAFESNMDFKKTANDFKVNDKTIIYYKNLCNLQKFKKLKDMISVIENKTNSLIEYYNKSIVASSETLVKNVTLIPQLCVNEIEKIKDEVGIERVCIDQKVFLEFDKRYKVLAGTQSDKLKKDISRFNEINSTLPDQIIGFTDNLCDEVEKMLSEKVHAQEFETLTHKIDASQIDEVTSATITYDTQIATGNQDYLKYTSLDNLKNFMSTSSNLSQRLNVSPSNPLLPQPVSSNDYLKDFNAMTNQNVYQNPTYAPQNNQNPAPLPQNSQNPASIPQKKQSFTSKKKDDLTNKFQPAVDSSNMMNSLSDYKNVASSGSQGMDKNEIQDQSSSQLNIDMDNSSNIPSNIFGAKNNAGNNELTNPLRVITTTIDIESKKYVRLPVISSSALPKGRMMDVMKALKDVCVKAPINRGDVIVKDVLGLNVDIISSKTIKD